MARGSITCPGRLGPSTPDSAAPPSARPHPRAVTTASLLPADSPRLGGVDEDHVRLLAEIEVILPPILVHHDTMRVIDGMHRLHAARLKGEAEIRAEFFYGTGEEAFLRAVEANISHGLPLSLAERRAAARRIIASYPPLSDRAVAASTGLAAKTVAALRRGSTGEPPQLNARLGADGRLHPVDGTAGRLRAAEIIAAQPSAPLRQIAMQAGVSIGTAQDVRARIRRGEDPLPRQQRAQRGASPPRPRVPLAPRPGAQPQGRTSGRDGRLILQSLMKDPSLRHTNTGRNLLRWLCSHVITADTWPGLIEAVPPHCAEVVAELARQCARTWSQLAHEAHQRSGRCVAVR